MADGDQDQQQQLSPQDVDDLRQVKTHLPAGDERHAKIDTLLQSQNGSPEQKSASVARNTQPTEFEKNNTPGFFGKAAEVARRFTQGAGVPQSTEREDYSLYPGLKTMFTHPVESGKLLVGGAKDAMDARMEKAEAEKSAMQKEPNFWKKANHYANAMAYGLEGSIPLVGPAVGSIADSAERGLKEKDPAEVMGAGAEALGAGVTAGLGARPKEIGGESFLTKAVSKARGTELTPAATATVRPEGAFQPALANTPKEVLDHATQEGINLTPFQAGEKKLSGKLQVAGEHGLVGGGDLDTAMKAERAKFGEAVNRMTEKVDPTRLGLSEEQAGESIKQATQTAKDVSHENASNNYKRIDYLMKEKVEPKSISDGWQKVREDLPMGAEEQILAQSPRSMRAVVEDLLSGKPEGFKPTFDQGIQLRKFFRDLADTEGLPSRTESLYKSMEKTVGKAMDATAQKLGSFKEWDAANQGWKDYTGKYGDKQSPLYKILQQKDPAKITRDLTNRASASDIEILRNEGMTSALEPLRRQVIQDIARNKFTVGRDGLGGYSDSFLNTLFGSGAKKELYLKADLARRMNWEPNPSGTGGTMLAAEQISKPSKIAGLFGAAKMSMPRPAASYLPQGAGTRYNISPGLITPAMLQSLRQQNQ